MGSTKRPGGQVAAYEKSRWRSRTFPGIESPRKRMPFYDKTEVLLPPIRASVDATESIVETHGPFE